MRIRLSPAERKEQLLDLGVRLLSTRPFQEISIDLLAEEAGISRGLLYHYFGGLVPFQEAVIRRAAEDLMERTDLPDIADPIERLNAAIAAYVDFVDQSFAGYLSLVRGAKSGNAVMSEIYDSARAALTDRILAAAPDLVPDTAANRLLVRGWQALAEELVIVWKTEATEMTRAELLSLLASALPALIGIK